MKKNNPFLIPAVLFSLLAITLVIAFFDALATSLIVCVVVAGLSALKFWIMYFMEQGKRNKSKGEDSCGGSE